jgi:hypothetical protein
MNTPELRSSDFIFETRNLNMNMNESKATRDFSEIEKLLPPIPDAVGTYANCLRTGNLLFLSGKGPIGTRGVVGWDLTREQGYKFARETGLMLIAVMKKELGDLGRVRRIV